MRYLLDTNLIAEITKLQPNSTVAAKLEQHSEEISISSISWHELWYGTNRLPESRKRQLLETYLYRLIDSQLPVLPYTQEAAQWFASERARLTNNGRPPSYADGQIAAIAHINNLILVTRNTSDFIHFDDLRLENWFEE